MKHSPKDWCVVGNCESCSDTWKSTKLIYSSIYLSVYISVCLSIYLSAYLSIHLYPSHSLSVRLCVFYVCMCARVLRVGVCVCVYVRVCICVYVRVYMYVIHMTTDIKWPILKTSRSVKPKRKSSYQNHKCLERTLDSVRLAMWLIIMALTVMVNWWWGCDGGGSTRWWWWWWWCDYDDKTNNHSLTVILMVVMQVWVVWWLQ